MNELDRWNFGSFLTRSMGGAKGLSQSDIVFRMTKVSKTPYHCLIKSPYRKVFQVHHRPIKGLFVVIHFLLIPSDICYIICFLLDMGPLSIRMNVFVKYFREFQTGYSSLKNVQN